MIFQTKDLIGIHYMSLVQNLISLNEQLKINENILAPMKSCQSIEIESLSFDDQKEIISYFLDGTLYISVHVPEKITESSLAQLKIQKDLLYIRLGNINLPSLKEPNVKDNKLQQLDRTFIGTLLTQRSINLKSLNKTLLAYVLMEKNIPDKIRLINGSWNKLPNDKLPDLFDSWEKIRSLIPAEKWMERLVSGESIYNASIHGDRPFVN